MDNKTGTEVTLEILVSTMNRNSLDFLAPMFINNNIFDLNILVVNQTSKDCLLISDSPNIRVINSFETGLSKSRNLAIENAIGSICLLADDDAVYIEQFAEKILHAFKNNQNCDVITFKTLTTEGKPYWNYPNKVVNVKSFYRKILSIEIAFKTQSIKENNLKFNEQFGLGSTFQDGENVFFFNEIFRRNLESKFVPEFIVEHKPYSSSDNVTSDNYFFARSAMYYKSYGILAYFYIIKLVFSLIRKGLIPLSEVIPKIKTAIEGIKKYKQLNRK